MKHVVPIAAALAVVGVFSATVAAQTARPDRSIQYRQGIFKAMNWHAGQLFAMAKGDRPYNKDEAVQRARYIDELAVMPWEGFAPGTEQGAPTKARPEVWKDGAKFKQYQDALKVETAKLVTAAGSGDAGQFKTQLSATAKACDNCHDDYRSK